jgi:hypothetical protein
MLRTWTVALASLALVSACQSTPKEDNAMVIEIGEDGQMRVVSAGDSPKDQAMALVLQSLMNDVVKEAEAAEPLSDEEVWHKDAGGNLTHIQSGAQCPVKWGDYARGRVTTIAPDGTDVGCNYNSPDGKVQTLYIYKSDLSLADELTSTVETMKLRQPVSEEAHFGAPGAAKGYVAQALAYTTASGERMRTSVLLTDGGEWRLKIRLTCPADGAQTAEIAAGIALTGQAERLAAPRQPLTATPAPI